VIGGPLAELGQLCLIESLPAGELRTGWHIIQEIQDTLNARNLRVRTSFREVGSADLLIEAIDKIHTETVASGMGALLHLDCHGSHDLAGLILADDSFLAWQDLKPRLSNLNLVSGFNLFLVLACCNGAYFLETTNLDECSAFCACLSPPQSIDAGPLETGFTAFYRAILAGQDVNTALTAAIAATPAFPYYFTSAEGLFRNVFARYINGEPLRTRAERVLQNQRGLGHHNLPSVDEMAQRLVQSEIDYFGRSRRSFFAIDQLPGNDARFPVTYADVVPAAHRAARGL
jgi:hypothetical protein